MKDYPTQDEIGFAISEIFTKTNEISHKDILGALVPYSFEPVRMICYWPEYEIDELCRCINQFKSYITDDVESPQKVRVMLLIYCHIMEAQFTPTVLWNCLRLLSGDSTSWDFYRVTQDGEKLCCELPRQRFTEIEKLSETQKVQIGVVLNRLWHNKLRNAFSHAQYMINAHGSFLGGKNISPITVRAVRKSDTAAGAGGENPYYYRFADILGLYTAALQYLGLFVEAYKNMLQPFKTGDFFETPAGRIRWNSARQGWTTS